MTFRDLPFQLLVRKTRPFLGSRELLDPLMTVTLVIVSTLPLASPNLNQGAFQRRSAAHESRTYIVAIRPGPPP